MKLTTTSALTLAQALPLLDKSADGKPFALPGKVRWNIVKNLAILTRFSEDYEKTRQGIIVALTPEGGTAADIDKDPALIASFRAQIKEILETDQEIPGLLTLALADLNLDANAIPVPVLLALQPLISE